MKKGFSKERFNIKKLEVCKEDIEYNKCIHSIFSAEDGVCQTCGTIINTNLNLDKLLSSTDVLIQYLETMKMVVNNSGLSHAEIKAAKKYTDIIPLLKNIDVLYTICKEQLDNSSIVPVEE